MKPGIEDALAIAGLACAVTGLGLAAREGRGHSAFWAALGLVLCQVLWLTRLF